MYRLLTAFILVSSMLHAEEIVQRHNHNHKKMWVEVAIVGTVIGTAILVERSQMHHTQPMQTPAPVQPMQAVQVPHSYVSMPAPFVTPAGIAITKPPTEMILPTLSTPLPPATNSNSIQTLCSMGFCQ